MKGVVVAEQKFGKSSLKQKWIEGSMRGEKVKKFSGYGMSGYDSRKR